MSLFSIASNLLLGTGPGGTINAIDQENKRAKAERKAEEIRRKIEERKTKREMLAQLRESQIARASATAAAVNTGAAESSGFSGQLNSIQSQTASNIAYSNQVQTGMNAIGAYMQDAAKAQQASGNWSAIASLSMQATQFI